MKTSQVVPSQEPIQVSSAGSAVTIAINRPHDENRIDMQAMELMSAAIERAEKNDECRVIVLTGSGEEFFCCGGRIGGYPGGTTKEQLEYARSFTVLQERMARAQKPLVAAVNGLCVAGGMSLLESCDVAIAVRTAEFGYPEIRHGLFPMLATAVARRNLPPKLAFDLFYSGRRMTAEEALTARLLSKVVDNADLLPSVSTVVEMLAANSQAAMMVGRQAFYAMAHMGPAAALEYAHVALVAMLNACSDEKKASK